MKLRFALPFYTSAGGPQGPAVRSALFLATLLLPSMAHPSPAMGQSTTQLSTGTINLQEILELVQRDNPDILAADKRWEAARKRISQAATPNKPRLDLERMYAPADKNVISGAVERNIAVTQEMPFPTTLYLQHGRATQEAQIAEQSYRAKVREVVARASTAYAMLFLNYKSMEIFDENIEIMRRFSKVAESKYAAGHSSQLDALKAEVELTKMLNMRYEAEQERGINESMLNALLNREALTPLGAPAEPGSGALSARLDELQAEAVAHRPELRQMFLETQRARTDLSLARSEYLPDLMLQYRWRNDPTMGNSNDAILGFSIPLWFWKPAAMVSEAKAEREMADAELQAMKVDTSADLRTAWLRAKTAKRLAEIYRTSLLPQAQESLSVAESGYQTDKSTFLDLLDAERSLLNSRLEYYQYLADYEQRLAELERIVGKEL